MRELRAADLCNLRCDQCGAGGAFSIAPVEPRDVRCAACGRQLGVLRVEDASELAAAAYDLAAKKRAADK